MTEKHEQIGITLSGIPLYKAYDFYYILQDEVPDKHKEEFFKWMYGQTGAIVNNDFVIYAHDWERWYNMKIHNIPTYFD